MSPKPVGAVMSLTSPPPVSAGSSQITDNEPSVGAESLQPHPLRSLVQNPSKTVEGKTPGIPIETMCTVVLNKQSCRHGNHPDPGSSDHTKIFFFTKNHDFSRVLIDFSTVVVVKHRW